MASQRDPQNLKNLTKSAKWPPQTPFENSFGRFHFRKGFQVVPKDLQNLKNHGFTLVNCGVGYFVLNNIFASGIISGSGDLFIGAGSTSDVVATFSHNKSGSLMEIKATEDSGSLVLSGSLLIKEGNILQDYLKDVNNLQEVNLN